MARRLRNFVHGLVDENGVACSFGPKDNVPAWAAKLITNPSAWADDDDQDPAAAPAATVPVEPSASESPILDRFQAAGATDDELAALGEFLADLDEAGRAEAEQDVTELDDEAMASMIEQWRSLVPEHDGDLAAAFEALTADEADDDGDEGDPIPPKAGAGSSAEAWIAYARSKGEEVADDAKRDEVIAQLEAAGIPVEPAAE